MDERISLSVDLVGDVVCPWCYVGRRRLVDAIAAVPELDISLRWRPFQLDASMPPAGVPYRPFMEKKFGGPDKVDTAWNRLRAVGDELGIPFAFERIATRPNTFNAHRLIRWAHGRGVEDEVVERLFAAFFVEGADFASLTPLLDIAETVDMDPEHVAERIADDVDRDAVDAELATAQKIGITEVPCTIIGNRYAVIGAQPTEVFIEALRKTAREQEAEQSPPPAHNDN